LKHLGRDDDEEKRRSYLDVPLKDAIPLPEYHSPHVRPLDEHTRYGERSPLLDQALDRYKRLEDKYELPYGKKPVRDEEYERPYYMRSWHKDNSGENFHRPLDYHRDRIYDQERIDRIEQPLKDFDNDIDRIPVRHHKVNNDLDSETRREGIHPETELEKGKMSKDIDEVSKINKHLDNVDDSKNNLKDSLK
jgi:hypothetical protein